MIASRAPCQVEGGATSLRRCAGAIGVLVLASACPNVPPADELSVRGKLERDGVEGTNLQDVEVAYASHEAKGEWWSCELRMTAGACDGDHHVNVWLAMPGTVHFADLGHAGCVDPDGNPFGVFEVLTDKLAHGENVLVPDDVEVLVRLASDKNGDGTADVADDAETKAAARMLKGNVEIVSLGTFNDPVALSVAGLTQGDSLKIDIGMNGKTAPVPNPGPDDVARTCVAKDAVP